MNRCSSKSGCKTGISRKYGPLGCAGADGQRRDRAAPRRAARTGRDRATCTSILLAGQGRKFPLLETGPLPATYTVSSMGAVPLAKSTMNKGPLSQISARLAGA